MGEGFFYPCGEASHTISECTFDENSKRIDNIHVRNEKHIKKDNSLNFLPYLHYNIFNKPSEKWVNMS